MKCKTSFSAEQLKKQKEKKPAQKLLELQKQISLQAFAIAHSDALITELLEVEILQPGIEPGSFAMCFEKTWVYYCMVKTTVSKQTQIGSIK